MLKAHGNCCASRDEYQPQRHNTLAAKQLLISGFGTITQPMCSASTAHSREYQFARLVPWQRRKQSWMGYGVVLSVGEHSPWQHSVASCGVCPLAAGSFSRRPAHFHAVRCCQCQPAWGLRAAMPPNHPLRHLMGRYPPGQGSPYFQSQPLQCSKCGSCFCCLSLLKRIRGSIAPRSARFFHLLCTQYRPGNCQSMFNHQSTAF